MIDKVLILGVAPVQMDAIVQLNRMGYETHACAMAKDGPGAYVADNFVKIDILDTESIIEYIKENKIDAVYSVGSDLAMPVSCQVSEELLLPHFVSSKVATVCNNKEMMRKALGDCEGNIPFAVIEDEQITPEFPLPFIMKPSDSQGQRGIFLIQSLQEYRKNFDIAKQYSRSGKVIVEKYVDGPELSVNVYLVDGKLKFMVASDRETWPQFTGLIHKHIVPTRVLNQEMLQQLEKVITAACKKIGIQNGPAYFQIKVEKGNPYIIEMTPRLDGCHMWNLLSYYTGINLIRLTFNHLLNGDVSELSKFHMNSSGYELEFFCQEPHTSMVQSKFVVPRDALDYFFYYETGDKIRPVNGKYEKVGYFIREMKR